MSAGRTVPAWVVVALVILVALALLAAVTPAVLDALTRYRDISYVTTETVYVQGRVVEWTVELVIRGESVRAMFASEREAMRLRDAVE